MANPNIVNVSDIRGKTSLSNVSTALSSIVSNSSSNTVFKINTLVISNIDGTNTSDVSVEILRSNVSYSLASTITVPADASLVVISKDNSIYLEEGDDLRIKSSTNDDLQAICSYEEIS